MPLRLGVVSYLNSIPLFRSLQDRSDVEIIERVPAELTDLLTTGAVDVALLPLFEYFRGIGEALIPGVSIASQGPVQSVALFLKKPMSEVRSLAADRASRSSVALLKVLLAERWARSVNLTLRRAELGVMLASFDAALIIGDAALRAQRQGGFAESVDLGAEWTRWTKLPFVYAAWTTRAGLDAGQFNELTERLNAARDQGYEMLDLIAREQEGRGGLDRDGIIGYLTENIQTSFDEPFQAGAREFGRYCLRHSLLSAPRAMRFSAD